MHNAIKRLIPGLQRELLHLLHTEGKTDAAGANPGLRKAMQEPIIQSLTIPETIPLPVKRQKGQEHQVKRPLIRRRKKFGFRLAK